ncbi:MAG: UPF0158 family protein [Anaerolineales bacterium]|jgi:hypothetical protein
MKQSKRKLKINMMDLELAFESRDNLFDFDYFLDLETGEVIMTTGEEGQLLEKIYERYGDPETGEVDWPTVLAQLDIPDWQKEPLIVADRVESGFGTRYIRIPQVESREGYHDMVAFIRTVSNPRLQSRLERAISGRGAFRYFKDVLSDYPKERERWFRFRDERMHQRVLDWLESKGIEPIEGNG